MHDNPTFEELSNSNIYKRVKMEDMIVSKKYIMLYHTNNKVMYINVIENNEDYFGYECLEKRNRFSIPSYKNIFEQYFLFYKEINDRDVRELKFLSHLSSRNINVKKECKINVLSLLDLASYISTFLEDPN
jgi:hypothetical protein